jgi:hypothetical protein
MHIHKPKPLHGVRELVTEIGIIVVGILIAIAAEQAVESWSWRHKVSESEQAMQAELVLDDGRQAYTRVAISPCLDRQLDEIVQAVATHQDRTKVTRLARAYSPPNYTWDDQAWQSAVAAGVSPHMGAERAAAWGGIYSQIPILSRLTEQEFMAVDSLRTLPIGEGPLDQEDAGRVLSATSHLQRLNIHLYAWAATFLKNFPVLHATIPVKSRAALLARARQKFGACVVIPNPDAVRGVDNLTSDEEMRSLMYRGDTALQP